MVWPYVTLVLMLLVAGAMLGAILVYLMARALVRPPRMMDGKAAWVLRRLSPADLGLAYAPADFHVRDEGSGEKLKLAAWWIPAAAGALRGRTCVLLHGFADAKVGGIAWAPTLHALGWNVLALDLRAHGESGGRYCSAGDHERRDVAQVLDQLRAARPADTRDLVLMGVSLGAAVAAATAADRDDLTAVILDSPNTDFARASATHMRVVGLPGGPFIPLAIRLAAWLARADFAATRPPDQFPRISAALLVIACEADPLLEPEDIAALEFALRARPADAPLAALWRIPDAGHLMALTADPDEYRRRVGDFLAAAVDARADAQRRDAERVEGRG